MTLEGALFSLAAFSALVLVLVLRERARVERRFTIYFAAGEVEKALPYARRLAARRADPLVRGRRLLNLGSLLLRLERWDEAERAFEDGRAAIVASARRAQDGSLVAESGEEAEALKGGLGSAIASLAWLALRKGDVGRARERAKELTAPEQAERRKVLDAAACLVEDKTAEARALLEEDAARWRGERGHGLVFAVLSAIYTKDGEAARAGELANVARERMTEPQRKEMRALLPGVFDFLG